MANRSDKSHQQLHLSYADVVYKSALNAFLFINDEGIILEANPASVKIFECSIDDITNQSLFSFLSTKKSVDIDSFWETFIKGVQNEITVYFLNDKNEEKTLALSGVSSIDNNLHLVMLRDLSANVKTETRLADSEQLLNAIIETGEECVKIIGLDSKILEINPAGLAIVEAEEEELVLGHSVLELVDEKYHQDFLNAIKEVFEGKSQNLEFEIKGYKGTHHWLQMKAVPLFGEDKNTVTAMLAVTQNITEQKSIEQSLIQSEKTLQDIFELSPIPLLISRVGDSKMMMTNQCLEKLLGKSKVELAEDFALNYYADQEERKEIVEEILLNGGVNGKEVNIVDMHGNVRSMLVYIQFLSIRNEKMLLSSFADITERKQKDRIIETTKNDLESIVNMLPDILFRFDSEHRFVFCHTNDKEQLIVPPELFLGKKPEQVLPLPLADLLNDKINLTRESNVLQVFEYPLTNGKETDWFECRMLNTNNKEVLAIIRNITLQKNGELAIKESEHKLRSLVQDLTVGVFVQDVNRKTILCNSTALELLRVTEEELKTTSVGAKGWSAIHEDGSLFNPEDYPISEAFETLTPIKNVSMGLSTPRNEEIVWLSVDAIPMKDEQGNLIHVVCTLYDISINKKAEEELHKSEDNLRTVFQHSGVGYILFDKEVRILAFNENAKGFTEFQHDKVLKEGDSIFEYIPLSRRDSIKEATQKVLQGQSFEYDVVSNTVGPEQQHFHVKFAPVYNKLQKVPGLIMSIEDITRRKNEELDLVNSLGLVTAQNERLLNFSYIVSHNLRSHTSNIKMILNLLEEETNEEEKKELLENLRSVSESLNETIHNLNDVVSIQNNIDNILDPLNLKDYTEQALTVLSKQAQQRNVDIYNNISEDVIIKYNPAYLESILLNFISNAIKYSDSKKDSFVKIDCFKEGEQLVLQIQDNGIGINMEKNGSRLFGMYKTFNGNSDARGLGLFISKNQIESMGGSVKVESKLHVGSTFKIYIQ